MWLADVSLLRVTGTSERVVLAPVASNGLYPSCDRIQQAFPSSPSVCSSEAGFG